MTETPARSLTVSQHSSLYSVVVFLCCAACVFAGCSIRKRPTIPWASAVQVKPVIDPQTVDTTSGPDDALPELLPELPPSPGYLITMPTAPPPPRAITSPSAVVGT